MPTYILLVRWTTQGLQKIKESPSRLEAGKKAFEAAGIKLRDFHMTLGRYDQVSIAEAPDDATMATALLRLASQGNLQTETLRAFTEDEIQEDYFRDWIIAFAKASIARMYLLGADRCPREAVRPRP